MAPPCPKFLKHFLAVTVPAYMKGILIGRAAWEFSMGPSDVEIKRCMMNVNDGTGHNYPFSFSLSPYSSRLANPNAPPPSAASVDFGLVFMPFKRCSVAAYS